MARILAGRRRYFGHKLRIRPNAKKLYRLFLNQENMTWEAFTSKVRWDQRGFIGKPKEVRPGRGEFHENPPTCICEYSDAMAQRNSGLTKFGKESEASRKDDVMSQDQNVDNEPEWPDTDEEDQDGLQDQGPFNFTNVDYDADKSCFQTKQPSKIVSAIAN